ncbi:MAG: ankryin [Acidobacteria bacterium]|nr:MAG: ankryin [Acidobacteriota bacterium]
MDAKVLPARPSLEQYKKQAKELVKAFRTGESGDPEAVQRIKKHHPRLSKLLDADIRNAKFALVDAQLVVAREHGFVSWPKFAKHVEALIREGSVVVLDNPWAAFIEAACVPRDSGHASGTLERAEAILAAHPGVASSDIHAAAILGDEAGVRRFLALNPGNATAKGGPHGWDALTHLCFSRYLRLDRARSDGFLRAATALLDAGASANTGWMEKSHQPRPEWESALYGAAGVAHHAELTRLLLERGADPNDGETPYHAPDTHDNAALKALVESGKLNEESLGMILLRKTDWHDYEGIKWLLEYGVDPNRRTPWGKTAIHNAVLCDNDLKIFEVLLDHGADPTLIADCPDRSRHASSGKSAVAMAARRGRRDVLELFERRGIPIVLQGVERLMAECARNDAARVRSMAGREPQLVREMVAEEGKLLAEFAGVGNTDGVRQLLDLGLSVAALYKEGDGYFDMAKNSTALHVAAWRAQHATVKLLIERGAPVDVPDGRGRTPLALAVRACVDSYWTYRRSPDSVRMLLHAGGSVSGIDFPSGYAEVDELLRRHGAKP